MGNPLRRVDKLKVRMLPTIIAPNCPVLVDQRIQIKVKNLSPFQSVTLRVELNSDKSDLFESYGHYIADRDGELNLSRDSSFGGTYKGIDNMGLFWSMLAVPGQRKGARFIAGDVTKPMEFRVFLFDRHVMSQGNADNPKQAVEKLPEPLAKTKILRTYLADHVERKEISVGRIRGTLFAPKGRRKLPGVIDMFGIYGDLIESRAAILASHGFVTFALAYFGYKDLPKSPNNIDLEYFIEAVKWFASHERVYSSGIGYIGSSSGSQIALQIGAECPLVKAVVGISAANIMIIPLKYKGKVISGLVGSFKREHYHINEKNEAVSIDSDSVELHKIEIQVEKIEGKIMLITGKDDVFANPSECARIIQGRLNEHGRKPATVLRYPGTGHLINVPFMPTCRIAYYSYYKVYVLWGGNVIEHSAAQEHAWTAIKRFLLENVQNVSSKL
ncbi:acyl-coenzyme A amino acid N-acyltransferase 2-like isoform X1 [Rhopilema esculentum]|uniref:acyl-coenzyme A amino acid N-acyltransferase 2-like isoform X1 n=1 Tax=Rhopilema esculentum TaxID=499914 RepID=UPI0031E285DA|eukprot:gene12910-3664_t